MLNNFRWQPDKKELEQAKKIIGEKLEGLFLLEVTTDVTGKTDDIYTYLDKYGNKLYYGSRQLYQIVYWTENARENHLIPRGYKRSVEQ
jgi:hypothetical protein